MSFYTEEKLNTIFIKCKASNSLPPQVLLQYVAATPNYIHCTVFLEMPVATFPVHTKPKVCTVFTGHTSNVIKDKPHVSHTSTQYHTCKHSYAYFH